MACCFADGYAEHHYGINPALGRVSGETAPILFTCAAYFPAAVADEYSGPVYGAAVSPVCDFHQRNGYGAQLPLAYGTALVLIMIILLVNLLANALRKYFEKRVKTNKLVYGYSKKIDARDVNFWYGDFHALKGISMQIEEKSVVAFYRTVGM